MCCLCLYPALARFEDDKASAALKDSARAAEMQSLRAALTKTTADLDRTRHQLHAFEAERGVMVSRDLVEQHLVRLNAQGDKLVSTDQRHKLLIQRYGALKTVIEDSFRKRDCLGFRLFFTYVIT